MKKMTKKELQAEVERLTRRNRRLERFLLGMGLYSTAVRPENLGLYIKSYVNQDIQGGRPQHVFDRCEFQSYLSNQLGVDRSQFFNEDGAWKYLPEVPLVGYTDSGGRDRRMCDDLSWCMAKDGQLHDSGHVETMCGQTVTASTKSREGVPWCRDCLDFFYGRE